MKIIGFKFRKINIEKKSDSLKGIKLSTKIDVLNITSAKNSILKGDEDLLKIDFMYNIKYDPVANIELGGMLLLSMEQSKAKEILLGWKDKKMDENFKIDLFNVILRKANVKALELEDEMNLPLHIPFPTLKKPKKE